MKNRKKNILFAGFIVFYFILVSSSPTLMLFTDHLQNQFAPPVQLSKLDAIVVLSGGTVLYNKNRDQFVYTGTAGRILEAIRLYKKGFAKYLVIDGGTPYAHGELDDEASSMKRVAIESGIPESAILLEPTSQTTYENGKNVVKLFSEHSIHSFYLVTSAFHMLRSVKVFEKQGLHPLPYPVDFEDKSSFNMNTGNLSQLNYLLHEYVGLIVYKFTGQL